MKKKTIIWTIIAIVIVVLLLAIAFIIKQVNHSGDKSSNGYDTYKVKEETPISIEGKASPQSVKTYNNNSQIGTFLSAAVEDGQKVKQGTQLISYNTNASKRTDLANKVDQAQQQVNKDYEEINKSPNNQQLQTKLTQDQSALNDAQQQLSQHDRQLNDSMYAAFDGTINIQNESNVGDGQPILQLISNQPEIKTTVSEFDIDKIKVGDKVNVAINSNGKKGEGKIIKINQLPTSFEDSANSGTSASSAANSASGEQGNEEQASAAQASNPTVNVPSGGKAGEPSKYTVVIGDLDIPVRPGLSLDAKIPLKTMKLPNNVLTKDNQVFVVDNNNKIHKREIKIDRNNGQIIVKKGLKAGDKVLKNPKGNLNDGEKVEVSS